MPAETHRRQESLTSRDILELIWLVAGPEDIDEPDPSSLVAAVGLHGDLVLLSLWAVVAEEFGERASGEPDLAELGAAPSFGELADVLKCSLNP